MSVSAPTLFLVNNKSLYTTQLGRGQRVPYLLAGSHLHHGDTRVIQQLMNS
jgi:hypothetical protein